MTYNLGDILLEKYRIEALLGEGAFGEVYLVTHLTLLVPRAIKVLRHDAPGVGSTLFGDAQARFLLESRLGARLNSPVANPHLLLVYDCHVSEEVCLLEMEYASGGSLAARLQAARDASQPMPITMALQIAGEVAGALAALHEKDIIHRDLKPSNILFDGQGHARLADLGLAQVPGGPSLRSQFSEPRPHPGTPEYMSPEQESSGKTLKPPSDVYALGLVLFEMLTGRSHTYAKPGTRASKLRADLPAALDDLLARMLAKDPEERPWDGEEAAGELRSLQAGSLAEQARGQAAQQAQAESEKQAELARQAAAARAEALARQKEAAQKQAEFLEEQRRQAEIARQEAAAREKALALERREQELARQRAEFEAAAKARRSEKSFLERFWPVLLVVGLLMLWGIGNLMNPAAIPTAAPAVTSVPAVIASTLAPIPPATALPPSTTSIPASPTALPVPSPTPGIMSTQVRQKDGMAMMYVPGATFTMGTDADFMTAVPHQVTLSAYWIDRMDVTNAMFAKFVSSQNYTTEAEKAGKSWVNTNLTEGISEEVRGADWQHPQGPTSSLSGLDQHPVVHVSWNDATAYCAWAGAGLPTEAQWELAARGTDGRAYPWAGDTIDKSYANYNNIIGDTTAVCSYPKGNSPSGVCDMAGNVWQWVADWYGSYDTSPVSNPTGPTSGQYRVMRGSPWVEFHNWLRSADRNVNSPANSGDDLGFRCARSN